MQAANFFGLTVEREDYGPEALGQNMATDDMATGDDQSLFQALDQRLGRLENDIAQNQKHILEATIKNRLESGGNPNASGLFGHN